MIARASLIRGPAIVTFKGVTWYTKDDITVNFDPTTFEIPTSAYGKADERFDSVVPKLSFTPVGKWSDLGVHFPYASAVVGASMFGASDSPVVVHSMVDGRKLTFAAGAITKLPDIMLGATKTLLGQMEISLVRADNTAWSTADSVVAVSQASFADASFDAADIITQPYTAAWGGSAPWSSFESEEGFVISQNVSFTPRSIDSVGVIDYTFSNLEVMAKCVPVFTPSASVEADIIGAMQIQGAGNFRGKSMSGSDLVISGTGVTVTIKGAAMKQGGFRWGSTVLRAAEIGFLATRATSGGAVLPLIVVA